MRTAAFAWGYSPMANTGYYAGPEEAMSTPQHRTASRYPILTGGTCSKNGYATTHWAHSIASSRIWKISKSTSDPDVRYMSVISPPCGNSIGSMQTLKQSP